MDIKEFKFIPGKGLLPLEFGMKRDQVWSLLYDETPGPVHRRKVPVIPHTPGVPHKEAEKEYDHWEYCRTYYEIINSHYHLIGVDLEGFPEDESYQEDYSSVEEMRSEVPYFVYLDGEEILRKTFSELRDLFHARGFEIYEESTCLRILELGILYVFEGSHEIDFPTSMRVADNKHMFV